MADDIVTRLRREIELVDTCICNWLIEDAADEIERLRAENNYLANCLERNHSSIGETLRAYDAWQEARRG